MSRLRRLLKRLLVEPGSLLSTALRTAGRLAHFRVRTSMKVESHILAADTSDRLIILSLHKLNLVESREKSLLDELIEPGMNTLDVGANIGIHTLRLARRVGPSGRVRSFEPDPGNFALLEANVRRNGYENVTCLRRAVSDRTGTAELHLSMGNTANHQLFDGGEGRATVTVETVRLDDAVPPGEKVDLIKMDIQGAELAAMAGMRRVVRESPDLRVLIEFCPVLLEAAGASAETFADYWREEGFQAFLIEDGLQPVSLDDGRAFASLGREQGYVDILLRRGGA